LWCRGARFVSPARRGIRQFLDIGTGIPTAGNTHEMALSHATPESFTRPASKELLNTVYAETASGGVTPRPKAEIERFFSGLEVTGPGVVNVTAWRPEPGAPGTRTLLYGGVARKKG
jgi:S-adenosyl methyltransferase